MKCEWRKEKVNVWVNASHTLSVFVAILLLLFFVAQACGLRYSKGERERKRKGTRTTRETKTYINRLRHKYTISQNNFNSPIRHQWMEPDKTYGENRMFMFTYEFFGTHTMFDFLYVAFSFDNWSHNDHCVNYIFFLSYSRFGSRCLTKTWNSYVNTNLLCVTQVGWCVSMWTIVRSVRRKSITL